MSLSQIPLWFWPALALGAALIYLFSQRRWPFDGPGPSPVLPPDPWLQLQSEIIRGVLAKQGLLPPIATPTSPRIIELPRKFMIVPVEESRT